MVVEQLGHDEMQQGPQFSHRVLDWSSGKEQSVSGLKSKENLPSSACIVLYCLSFVEDHVVPFDFHQFGLVLNVVDDKVVGSD